MKVLAISGSLREASYNTALARAAIELAPAGVEVELYDGLAQLPPYDEDLDGEDAPIAEHGKLFQQVALPAGRYEVRFDYAPPHIGWAWLLAALGAIALGVGPRGLRYRPR